MKYLLLLALAGCGAATAQDKSEDAQYASQQMSCITAFPGNKVQQDACIDAVKKLWCVQWKQRFDAGVCP